MATGLPRIAAVVGTNGPNPGCSRDRSEEFRKGNFPNQEKTGRASPKGTAGRTTSNETGFGLVSCRHGCTRSSSSRCRSHLLSATEVVLVGVEDSEHHR